MKQSGTFSLPRIDFPIFFFFDNSIYLFYLFLAVLGLHCCVGSSPTVASGGYSLAVVRVCGLLIAVASPVEHRLLGFGTCDSLASRAQA